MRLTSSISCFLYLLASTRRASIVKATSSVIEHDGDWQWHRVIEQTHAQSPSQLRKETSTNDATWIFDPVACFGVGRENYFILSFTEGFKGGVSVDDDWGDNANREVPVYFVPSWGWSLTFSHTYDAPGTYEPRITVKENSGTMLRTDPFGDKFIVSENDCKIVNPPPKPDYDPVEWVSRLGGCRTHQISGHEFIESPPPPSVNRIALVVSEDYGGQNIVINGTWDDGPDAIVVETSEVPADGTTLFFEHIYSEASVYSPMFSAHLEDGAIIEADLNTPWRMCTWNNITACSSYMCDSSTSQPTGTLQTAPFPTPVSSVVPHGRPFAQCFLALLSFIFFAL